jgi:ribose-phosphate pyrophosphokinase
VAEVMHIIGDVSGKKAIIIDDIIDTGGTIIEVVQALRAEGATEVFACCTHPVFSSPAIKGLEDADLSEVVVTNTIPIPPEKRTKNTVVLSVASIFGEAIRRIFEELSVSILFD